MSQHIRLRGKRARLSSAWPLGDFPKPVIVGIGRYIIHKIATSHADIAGDDFGTLFAKAINGEHLGSPLGVADVVFQNKAWSVKTIKASKPFNQKMVRLISGRNSPDYSSGIQNPHADIAATGAAVLGIWNARVNEVLSEYQDLRIAVLIRNVLTREFVLFEEVAHRFAAGDYDWRKNKNNNFEGYEKATGEHRFIWQPHGGQFTIKRHVPGSAVKFIINRQPPVIDINHILELIKYNESWVEIIR